MSSDFRGFSAFRDILRNLKGVSWDLRDLASRAVKGFHGSSRGCQGCFGDTQGVLGSAVMVQSELITHDFQPSAPSKLKNPEENNLSIALN